MNITKQQLADVREIIEDSVEYYCDQEMISGELVWTVIECLSTAKIAEIKGLLAEA